MAFENTLFRAQYHLTPIAKQFSTSKTQIFPWEFFDSITRTHVLWIWVTSSLHFPVLLLGTPSLEIEALDTAMKVLKGLEVLEVDVLEDDAIFDLRPEGLSRRAISVVAWGESQSLRYAQGNLESAGPYLTMGLNTDLNIFQKQYRNKMQTELFRNFDFFFVFNA